MVRGHGIRSNKKNAVDIELMEIVLSRDEIF